MRVGDDLLAAVMLLYFGDDGEEHTAPSWVLRWWSYVSLDDQEGLSVEGDLLENPMSIQADVLAISICFDIVVADSHEFRVDVKGIARSGLESAPGHRLYTLAQ